MDKYIIFSIFKLKSDNYLARANLKMLYVAFTENSPHFPVPLLQNNPQLLLLYLPDFL